MTKDEILNMEAGEQIDTLIAEKVMGWHRVHDEKWRDQWHDSGGRYQHPISRYDGYEDQEDFHTICWHPSESILWTWELIEKMPDNLELKLEQVKLSDSWVAGFYTPDDVVYQASANSAELAICRAALLTVLERESD